MNNWIKFIRQYGPIAQADNMYDEHIQKSAIRSGILPIEFEHPALHDVVSSFAKPNADPVSVILTGTAGDGKTHLCRNVWNLLNGSSSVWDSKDPHVSLTFNYPKDKSKWPDSDNPTLFRCVKVHFIRDLSAWTPQHGLDWPSDKIELLELCSRSFFDPDINDIFLIAANDGQLVECWRRFPSESQNILKARQVIEDLLVEERQQEPDTRLKMFNLSRVSSTELFDRALESFLRHPGWTTCYSDAVEEGFFGSRCPIRHNYELLKDATIKKRLRSLIELCDHNGLHIPIRQILLLLANAILGHEDVKDCLMRDKDIPKILRDGSLSKASLFSNIFGGNLSESRRTAITVFDYLDRFQIGSETSNRIDNILIFGEADEVLSKHFNSLVASDSFYGADERYYAAKMRYVEGAEEDDTESNRQFMDMLVSQRRGLFFKIPPEQESDLNLWSLTVFKFAGEFIDDVALALSKGISLKRPIIARLIQGLNRIFSGMLINSDRELFLTTSSNNSQAKISRLLIERISVEPSKGERISMSLNPQNKSVQLNFQFSPDEIIVFPLTLTRYEFLSRIATEGALPASFSKECYEDVLSLKSRLLAIAQRRNPPKTDHVHLRVLSLSEQGLPSEQFVEVLI
jgi:hypothetical protein